MKTTSTVTIGILAHVDAGKTSLTERLLHHAGVIDHVGSVDRGDTQTDSMELERRRGITIRAAVVSLVLDGLRINLVDTPGHPDFIAEVERALSVLDGVVLVLSAVEGVQAQTRLLLRTLTRLRMPTLLFVNKIDRAGARTETLLDEIRTRLTPDVVALSRVEGAGTRTAAAHPLPVERPDVVEALAERDDAFLARYLDDPHVPAAAELTAQVRAGRVHPVFFGSAATGAGITELVDGVLRYLPRSGDDSDSESGGDSGGELRASVFAIERDRAGEKVAYVRMRSGTLAPRVAVPIHRPGGGALSGRATAVAVFTGGATAVPGVAGAGDIAQVRGLREVRIGDQLGTASGLDGHHLFAPPALETLVAAARPESTPRLYAALLQLTDQDPLIDVRRDAETGEIAVSLYGEVQREVLADTLAERYGIDAVFAETRIVHVERVVDVGEAVEELGGGGPVSFWATVGLRVEPLEPGSGVDVRLAVELGALPLSFHTAIEETVRATLRQGLCGWEVIDVRVTVTRTGYDSVMSTAGDFRRLTPLVLMAALRRAGTRVQEPVHRFDLEVPRDTVSAIMAALVDVGAVPDDITTSGAMSVLVGAIPAGGVQALERALPGLTQGEGTLVTRFSGYRPVSGPPPTRRRTDGNPLDRREYLLHVRGTY